jgi:antirestriction protein
MEGVPQQEQEDLEGAQLEAERVAGQAPGEEASSEDEPQLRPRIYIASLSDYNAGRLHGIWIDATHEPEAIQEAIDEMLKASPTAPDAEEWAIHDFEDFNGLHLGEWENLEHVSRIARGIEDYGVAFAHWATLVSEDEELAKFDERYLGKWEDVTEYAEDVLEDLGINEELDRCVPKNLRPYVKLDSEGFGRDLVLGGDITAIDIHGGVYLFANR